MEKKLEQIISKSEIYDLVCKYMRGLDRLDQNIFRSVFHDDAYCCLLYTSDAADE